MRRASPIRKIGEGTLAGCGMVLGVCVIFLIPSLLLSIVAFGKLNPEGIDLWNIHSEAENVPAILTSIVIGIRAFMRIPFFSTERLSHFKSLPWEPDKPFPGGPFEFSLRVWSFLIAASALTWHLIGSPWYWIPVTALAVQVAAIGVILWGSSTYWRSAYFVIFAVILSWILPYTIPVFSAVMIFSYWSMTVIMKRLLTKPCDESIQTKLETYSAIPWPLSEIQPVQNSKSRTRRFEHYAIITVISLIAVFAVQEAVSSFRLVFLTAGILPVFSLIPYISQRLSPVPIIGRILKGPRLIPVYDKIFLTPLAVWGVLILAWGLSKMIPPLWMPTYAGVAIFAALTLGRIILPKLESWKLLAPARLLSFPLSNNRKTNLKKR